MVTRAPSPDARLTETDLVAIEARSAAALEHYAEPLVRHLSCYDVPRLAAEVRAGREREKALREALWRYGTHHPDCLSRRR